LARKLEESKKIEIKIIENEDDRLSTLCGGEILFIIFSPAGKPYLFGHPSVESFAKCFSNTSQPLNGATDAPVEAYLKLNLRELYEQDERFIEFINLISVTREKKIATIFSTHASMDENIVRETSQSFCIRIFENKSREIMTRFKRATQLRSLILVGFFRAQDCRNLESGTRVSRLDNSKRPNPGFETISYIEDILSFDEPDEMAEQTIRQLAIALDEQQPLCIAYPAGRMADSAREWLFYLPPGSFNTCCDMSPLFLDRFFPAAREAKLRKDIKGIH
ncbi:hypothetical protein Gogos_004734, partial [Gossypium gossypioides]|nr:hypothetical protein [Gossypium gossypioides]